jgi:hypothetical protein
VRQPAGRRQAQLPPCRAKTLALVIPNEARGLFSFASREIVGPAQ